LLVESPIYENQVDDKHDNHVDDECKNYTRGYDQYENVLINNQTSEDTPDYINISTENILGKL